MPQSLQKPILFTTFYFVFLTAVAFRLQKPGFLKLFSNAILLFSLPGCADAPPALPTRIFPTNMHANARTHAHTHSYLHTYALTPTHTHTHTDTNDIDP